MRIGGYLDYANLQDYSRIKQMDDDGSVVEKISDVQSQNAKVKDTSVNQENSESEQDKRELLSSDRLIDIAVNKGLKSDKGLIGSKSSIESLDVKKAISDMQKDKILMEYQTFVRNPQTEDGFVRQINNG